MALSEQIIIEMQAQGGAQAASQVDQVSDATADVGEASAETEGKFAKMAAGITAGAAVAAAAIAAISANLDIQDAGTKLQAQLGLDDSSAAYGGKLAGSIYAQNFGDSVEDSADAIRASVQNITGDLDDGGNEAAAKSLLGIKQAFGAESDEVGRTVGALLKNGMASSSEQAFDIITRGFQKGADKGGEFLDTLNEYSEPFKSLGFSARDATNALVQGSQNGVYSVDKIGDAVKEFGIRALDGSDTTKQGFKGIGLDADAMAAKIAKGGPSAKKAFAETLSGLRAMRDPVKREQAGVALFGSMWEDVGAKAILGLKPTQNELGKTKGATDAMNDALGAGLRARFEGIKRAAMSAFSGALISSIHAVINGVSWIVREFKKGNPIVVVTATILGTITAILVGQALALGAVALATLTWTAITKAARLAQLAWNASLLANPLTWIVIAIVAFGVAIWQLWKRNETFREGVKKVWSAIRSAVGGAVEWIKPKVAAAWEFIGGVINRGKRIVTGYIDIWKSVISFFRGLPGKISSAVSGMWNGLKDAFKDALNWIIEKWNGFEIGFGPVAVPGLPDIPRMSIGTPNIPMLATGGEIKQGGWAVVGERGPELAKFPGGSKVFDAQQSAGAMGNQGGSMRLEIVGGTPELRALARLLFKEANWVAAHT